VSPLAFKDHLILQCFRYDFPFIQHTYLHHVTRIDHRHNFSPYNTLLYISSASPSTHSIKLESLAFIPQLFLSALALPLLLAKKDLPSTMLAQTFAFVTFNKVCTSQVCHFLTLPSCDILTDQVFPLVHNLPSLLPLSSQLYSPVLATDWAHRSRSLGSSPSVVATARFPA
jgi:hypothetical protein